jgi:iron complex transport system substrate-binding protein
MLQPLIVAGPQTLANDLLQTVGAENVVPKSPGRFPNWNPEALLAADPDILLVSQHSVEMNPGELFAGWSALKAVRENRVVSIDPDLILRPGPRLAFGLMELTRAVHGLEVQIQETSCQE